MKDEQLKNIWNMISDETAAPDGLHLSQEQAISSRSGSVQNKIRNMLQNDLILKAVSGIAFLTDLLFYHQNPQVIYVCIGGILFLTLMTTIQWKTLAGLNQVSDPGLPTREVLSNLLVYLKRKSNLFELTIASSQILIFVPGLLVYYYLVYGQVKPMTGLSFAVYTILILIGTITSYIRIQSQLKFHIKYIHVCLSDLNDNALNFAFNTIETQRKQDNLTRLLVGLLLIFGFVALLAVMKSIM